MEPGSRSHQRCALRHHPAHAELLARSESEIHRWVLIASAADALALARRRETALGGGDEREPRLRGRHRARRADEERGPELLLELPYALSECGRRQRHLARGEAEVEHARGGEEAAQAVERREDTHERIVSIFDTDGE